MPRIRQYAERDAMRDFVAEINAQSARFGYRSQKALGSAIGTCQSTAGKYLKKPEAIPLGIIRNIVKALKPDPVLLLRAVGYSTKDIQKIREAS